MNDHTKRLVGHIYRAFQDYERNIITVEGLLLNVEGNIGAIEEIEVSNELENIASIVDEARWIYSDEDARKIIFEQLDKLKVLMELG